VIASLQTSEKAYLESAG